MLHSATSIEFLKSPPGNRPEKLSDKRHEMWSIRINKQWRLCVQFQNGDASDVEIVDYH
jgi:toxin HigB-1